MKLVEKPTESSSNLSLTERETLKSLQKRSDIIIHRADKGGKIVVMDKDVYINDCKYQLDNEEFYTKINHDPTENICENIESEISKMVEKKLIDKKEPQLLKETLEQPRLSILYELPKIHKMFHDFPPIRPIVSGFKSHTSALSEYLDTFLKYQARKCNSYVRVTKDFLSKLQNIKVLPDNAILVTMDVASLYTNIDHDEGATTCFERLEKRINKKVPSSTIKNLIKLVLSTNVFRFDN